jgi:hypothetical protein
MPEPTTGPLTRASTWGYSGRAEHPTALPSGRVGGSAAR